VTARERMLAALGRRVPDRLPVTTHHLMPSYLKGTSNREFFDRFGMDAIHWTEPRIASASTDWRVTSEELEPAPRRATRYRIATPRKTLTMVIETAPETDWVSERLIKEKSDIELIEAFAVVPTCDVREVNRQAEVFGERGIVRGSVPGFDIYGQPGCWQDAAVLYGIEPLILATYDDPEWVRAFLGILRDRKTAALRTMVGARFDLIELGGGDASSTVISPKIFDTFVAPYDRPLIAEAHALGLRVVYHTCGGMMPLLERIADMKPDAMETFTPPSLGGDVVLREAKERIGSRVCMIGGFDQCRYFTGCAEDETRRAVRECFAAAGCGGGFILAPSDHFFKADANLLHAFADEARRCTY